LLLVLLHERLTIRSSFNSWTPLIKHNLRRTLSVLLAIILGGIGSQLIFSAMQAHAQVIGAGEQYKIIDGRQANLEAALNQLGSEGWKVRASIGLFVILAK
jgi:hypothetical protein